MKIINARQPNDIKDWVPQETLDEIRGYESGRDDNFEVYDSEANEEPLQIYEIEEGDDVARSYLAENYVPTGESLRVPLQEGNEFKRREDGIPEEAMPEGAPGEDVVEEDPLIKTREEAAEDEEDESVAEATEIDERVPDFATTEDAIKAAIEENRVMEIFYVTKGRGSRDEKHYLKRERGLSREPSGGVNIHRIVEPHYIYEPKDPKNNQKIIVTYDRSVRKIRSFVIDNIYQYNFTKNRKTKEDQYFKPRIKRIKSPGKGIKTMENTNDKLVKIASTLEDKGLEKSSSIVRDAEKALSNFKMAQYVGVQGYWLKNRRCWDNCYRQKRTSQPGSPAQEVWMECWDEYKDSINNAKSTWAKYASKTDSLQIKKAEEVAWNKIFADKVDAKVLAGLNRPEAIYSVIESESKAYTTKAIEASSNLMTLADTLAENGHKELGLHLAQMSMDMLKESGPGWEAVKDFGRNLMNPGQALQDWAAKKGRLLKELGAFADKASGLANQISKQIGYRSNRSRKASGKTIIVEAERDPTKEVTPSSAQLQPKGNPDAKVEPPVEPDPVAETPPAKDPRAATEPQMNYIGQAQDMATAADQLINWIRTSVPMDNPRVKGIAEKATFNLQQNATAIRSYLSGAKINYAGIAEKLNEMAQGASMAAESLYQEQPANPDPAANVDPAATVPKVDTATQPNTLEPPSGLDEAQQSQQLQELSAEIAANKIAKGLKDRMDGANMSLGDVVFLMQQFESRGVVFNIPNLAKLHTTLSESVPPEQSVKQPADDGSPF